MGNKLEEVAIIQRGILIPKNDFNNETGGNNYTAHHSKALADDLTPEEGRGTGNFLDAENQNVGTYTDKFGNTTIPGSGRKAAYANNGSTWGYTPDSYYKKPDMSGNIGQVDIVD